MTNKKNNLSDKNKEQDILDKDCSQLTEKEYEEKELADLKTESAQGVHPSITKYNKDKDKDKKEDKDKN